MGGRRPTVTIGIEKSRKVHSEDAVTYLLRTFSFIREASGQSAVGVSNEDHIGIDLSPNYGQLTAVP